MDRFTTIIIYILLATIHGCCCNLVDYYTNLILSEEKRSETFVLPTNTYAYKPRSDTQNDYGTFDYIIVGAGSAGAVIASRLSEDPNLQVLLLEAGTYGTNLTNVPAMGGLALNLEFNWNYFSTPQESFCLGMFSRKCYHPRGKGMGGSSMVNGLFYTRGNKNDYNTWCAGGNPGWCYDQLLPFFKKSENALINGDQGYHSTGGYLNVEDYKPDSLNMLRFLEATRELNITEVDYNGKNQMGVGKIQLNTVHGQRGSTARTFLKPAENRENLIISDQSYVTKILINPKSKIAHGVRFARNNQYFVANSRREVILSAGAINSPQLLMLSGIGPKDHLDELGIPVIKNLEVGSNLQEHSGYPALHFVTNNRDAPKDLAGNVQDFLNGFGILTNPFNAQAAAFIPADLDGCAEYPEIEVLFLGSNLISPGLGKFYNFNEESLQHAWTVDDPSRIFTIQVMLLKPKSRGTVRLQSSDPFVYPVIDTKGLSDPWDIETIYQGIQSTLKLLDTTAFKKLEVELKFIHLPACKKYEYLSKKYWYCHIRQLGSTFAHPVGTCKMGPSTSNGSVVDHQLKVHGIKRLRVADASVMPEIPSGHTNAPTIMIGEKAAHMIKFE